MIGAGPAGALAARQLALAGADVLLVERKSLPRPKACGGCFSARAITALNRAGLTELAGSLAGVPLRTLEIRRGSRSLTLPLPEGGLALPRDQFDAALTDAAVAAGAELLPDTQASVRNCDRDGSCPVDLQTSGGPVCEIRARVVIAADGLARSSLRHCPEFTSQIAPSARIGLAAAVHAFPAEYEPGTIYMAAGNRGYAGLVRCGSGLLNVAAAVDREFVRQSGGPANAVSAILAQAGVPPVTSLSDATWLGTERLTRRTSRVADRRVFVLGDAAGYVEPFTGEGLAWAFEGALALAPIVVDALHGWDDRFATAWERSHRRLIVRRQHWCHLVAGVLRRPLLMDAIMHVLGPFPKAAGPVVRRISGSSVAASRAASWTA